jgi:Na+/H+ antiporter NhaD/arsenite permease-like protein
LRGIGPHPGTAPGWPTVRAVIAHAVIDDYAPFVILLFSLYTISGGLHLIGDVTPRPALNTGVLVLGAILANLVGTTGASMLLIAPLIEANRRRSSSTHTVLFFIFVVSNIGGTLTPLGDPPLFLGYLQGVPFSWTLGLWKPWLACLTFLLAVYYAWDRVAFAREPAPIVAVPKESRQPLKLRGTINLVWLVGVVLTVALVVPGKTLPGTDWSVRPFVREAIMLALVGLSVVTTPKGLKNDAGFTYDAMIEVAALFLGIFLTMQVPVEILEVRGPSLGLHSPLQFFWACGSLSGVLDNAPTYLVFFETARSLPAGGHRVLELAKGSGGPIREDLLAAISCSSVFLGTLTYLGNGPNLMVKSIAEARGVRMPGFFGYMGYSVTILIPLFLVVSVWFFA